MIVRTICGLKTRIPSPAARTDRFGKVFRPDAVPEFGNPHTRRTSDAGTSGRISSCAAIRRPAVSDELPVVAQFALVRTLCGRAVAIAGKGRRERCERPELLTR
jgi:hypothetical protein